MPQEFARPQQEGPKVQSVYEQARDRVRLVPNSTVTQLPTYKPMVFEEPKFSIGRWGKQQVKDISAIVTGLPEFFAQVGEAWGTGEVSKSAKYIWDALQDDPSLTWNSTKKALSDTFKVVTGHYRDKDGNFTGTSFAKGLRDRTALALLDALTVYSMGTAGVGAAARTTGALGLTKGMGGRLGSLYSQMSRIERIPYSLLANGAKKLESIGPIKKIETKLGITPMARYEYNNIVMRHVNARAEMATKQNYDLRKHTVPKETWAELHRITAGVDSPEGLIPIMEKYPAVREWLTERSRHVSEWEQLLEDLDTQMQTGEASQGLFERAKDKKAAAILRGAFDMDKDPSELRFMDEIELRETGMRIDRQSGLPVAETGDFTPEELDYANALRKLNLARAEQIGGKQLRNLIDNQYFSWSQDHTMNIWDMWDALANPNKGQVKNFIQQFQKFNAGKKPSDMNPQLLAERYNLRNAEYIGWMEGIQALHKKYGRPLNSIDEVRPGHSASPDFYPKYVDIRRNAIGLANSYLAEALNKHGKITPAVINEVAAKMGTGIGPQVDDLMEAILNSKFIELPEDAANMLNMALKPPTPLGALIHKSQDYWRELVIGLNPSFYAGNIIGNAILQMMYGLRSFATSGRDLNLTTSKIKDGMREFLTGGVEYRNVPGEVSARGMMYETAQHLPATGGGGSFKEWATTFSPTMSLKESWGYQTLRDWLTGHTDRAPRLRVFMAEARDALARERELRGIAAPLSGKSMDMLVQDTLDMDAVVQQLRGSLLSQSSFDPTVVRKGVQAGRKIPDQEKWLARHRDRAGQRGALDALEGAEGGVETTKVKKYLQIKKNIRKNEMYANLGAEEFWLSLYKSQDKQRLIEQLAPYADKVESWIRTVETFMGNYGRTLPFERRYIRTMVPFWTFARTMHMLALKMPFIRPGTTWLWNQLTRAALDTFDDEGLPDYLKGTMWIGTTEDGRSVFARMNRFNIFDSITTRQMFGMPFPKLFDPFQSPLLSVLVSGATGVDRFGQPAPLGNTRVVDTLGRVWEWDDFNHKAVRASRQTPLLDTFLDIFPQGAWMNDILAAYGFDAPGRGPKIYKSPSGKVLNQRNAAWSLGRVIGMPIDSVQNDQARKQERIDRRRLIKLFVQRARYSPPAERKQLLKIAYDALHGGELDVEPLRSSPQMEPNLP